MASESSETLDAIASRARALSVACDSPSTSASSRSRERLDAIDALRDAVGECDGSTTERADEALRAGEDALATCVVEPAGEVSAQRATMTLCACYRATGAGSMYSRANQLLDAATEKNASAFAKASAFKALTRLVKEFRERLGGNASAYARAASANFRPNDDAECRRAATAFFAAACEASTGNLDGKSIAGYHKALTRIESDKSEGVRAAVAEAFGMLTLAWSASREKGAAGDGDLDVHATAQRVVRALSDESARVRDAASGALVNVALACARGAFAESRDGEFETAAEPAFARVARVFMYAPFVAASRGHSRADERVCVGIARAWSMFVHRAQSENIADRYEIRECTVKTLLSRAIENTPLACACAIYVIRAGCLVNADEASLRATLSIVIDALKSEDSCRVLVATRVAKDIVEVIGSVDGELWESTASSLTEVLAHADRNVQGEAVFALRALALACPTKFVTQLLRAMAQLGALFAAVDEADSIKARGAAFHTAALVSIGAEFTCGLPETIFRDAVTLGIRCATGPGNARVREGGWVVISACLAGAGADVASKMCGGSIKFALTATFDAVVESGTEGEFGEIYAAAAVAEALSAWLMGSQSEAVSLVPLLSSGISAAERILGSRHVSGAEEHAKSLFIFRMFELLNSVHDTAIYEQLHGRVVALCQAKTRAGTSADEPQPENFLRSQLSADDAYLGPWTSKPDEYLEELCNFEGANDSPHPRVWIGLSEALAFPKARSMRAATRQAQGLQLAKVFTASAELRFGILAYFLNTAHRVLGTAMEDRDAYERGVFVPKKPKVLSVLGATLRRRTRSGGVEELHERTIDLTLLSADVLATAKHFVEHTKTQDATLMAEFVKVANIIRYAEFASTPHWRALAEIYAYSNAMNPDASALANALIQASKELVDIPKDSPARNIGALSVAATFRCAGVMALRQACRPVVTNLLQVSMQVDNVNSSHIWSTHGICVIGTHAGQSFVRDADDGINLAFALADAPFLLDEDNGTMTRLTAARLVNTAMAAIGPDLDHDSTAFKRSESLIEILSESEEPAARLESTIFAQHIATFTPHTERGRALLPRLRLMLNATMDSSTTNAVLSILRHILERDSLNIASQSGLDAELLTVLDRESNPKTRDTIKRCIELYIKDVCRRQPREAMVSLSEVALHTTNPVRSTSSAAIAYDDEEDDNADADLAVVDEAENSTLVERGAPKLSTRLFAAHLLSQIPLLIGQEVEHRNLEIARRSADDHWMALHAQHAFDLAYRLSVSPVDALHAPGLDMFSNLMDLWSHDKDPDSVADGDERVLFALEQYQAQLLSAMRASDPEHASLEGLLALLRLVSSALTSCITGEDAAMTRRLANVVTKMALEWREGNSDILCGKACNETVAMQARYSLVVSIARIASSGSEAVPKDVLTSINDKWLTIVDAPPIYATNDDVIAIIMACSTIEQEETRLDYLRTLCFKSIICGFVKNHVLCEANVHMALQALKNIVERQASVLLPSEVEVIGEAVKHLDDPATYDELSVFMDHMVTAERIRGDALVCAVELLASVMFKTSARLFSEMFATCLKLAKRNKRASERVSAVVAYIFTDENNASHRMCVLQTIRDAQPEIMLHALKTSGHVLASFAQRETRMCYEKKVSGEESPVDEFVSHALQTWAAAFLLLKDEVENPMCATCLAIFLAIAVEVVSPEGIVQAAIDPTLGKLASQILVRLATVCADPFRHVVGQLSDESKARLQTVLNFTPQK